MSMSSSSDHKMAVAVAVDEAESTSIASDSLQSPLSGSIFDYIKSQSKQVADSIYGGVTTSSSVLQQEQAPWACKAVFQSVSMVAKMHVMNLIFLGNEYTFSTESIIESMSTKNPSAHAKHRSALQELVALKIISPILQNDRQYQMNSHFQTSFKLALSCPQEPWSTTNDESANSNVPYLDSAELAAVEEISKKKFHNLLGILVGIRPKEKQRFIDAMHMFVSRAGMMVKGSITSKGYNYLLKSYHSQVWDFVCETIKISDKQEEALSLLFMLSYCNIGRGYRIDALTESQKILIKDFAQVGIIYIPPATPDSPTGIESFFPTKIATDMIFGASSADNSAIGPAGSVSQVLMDNHLISSSLYIIVETNLQVTAYASTDLHMAMLNLFIDVTLRLPNMVMGRLTRDKCKRAFMMGIEAVQVIEFLVMHAHPQTRQRKCGRIIPENVTDRLAQWESENYRIKSQDAILLDFKEIIGFDRKTYSRLMRHCFLVDGKTGTSNGKGSTTEGAQVSQTLMWRNDEQMMIAVDPNSNALQDVNDFLQRNIV